MIIRQALHGDAATIIDFQMKMALETEEMALDRDTLAKGVEAIFTDPRKGIYYIAEIEGQVAGCLLLLDEWSDWRNGYVKWIHSVYVDSDFRGRGVFKKMYQYLESVVHEEGHRGLRLYVDLSNTGAQKVYEKMGMNRDHYYLYEWLK